MRFLPKRRIRVDIVTIFLALISVSCLIIIIYMYHKNYRGILDISKVMMQQLSLGVVEKISGITTQTQLVTGLARSNISQLSDISGDNHDLVRYLLNALKFSPFVTNINVASENGSFVSVGNLPLFGKHHYYFEPEHALPQGSKYSIRTIDSTAGTDRWEYLNTDLNTIAVESTPKIAHDPRITDWYAQVQIWPRSYWTRLYNDLLKESVLTFALPIYDDANQLIGVVSVDMALKQLENYISHQRIGLSGKAFILDEQGHVVIPELRLEQLMQIDPFLVKTAHETYVKSPQGTMLIQKGMEPYLCHVVDFPLSPETRWYIVTVVPFNDFVRTIIETQQHSVYISLAVLAVFCAVVYFASRHISIPIIQLAEEVEKIQELEFEESKMKKSQIVEINKLQTSLSTMRKALRAFGCYVPKEIVHALLRQGEEIS
ncbi:MAG TPA: cache domain-containing protein [Terrimicrobiaceae bacterium]